jgi:hypothetical protein
LIVFAKETIGSTKPTGLPEGEELPGPARPGPDDREIQGNRDGDRPGIRGTQEIAGFPEPGPPGQQRDDREGHRDVHVPATEMPHQWIDAVRTVRGMAPVHGPPIPSTAAPGAGRTATMNPSSFSQNGWKYCGSLSRWRMPGIAECGSVRNFASGA